MDTVTISQPGSQYDGGEYEVLEQAEDAEGNRLYIVDIGDGVRAGFSADEIEEV